MARDWRDSYDTVRVWTRTQTGSDPLGEPVYSWSFTDVRGVSVRNGSDSQGMRLGDTASDLRPDGVRVRYALAFPKGHGLSLRHARVTFLNPVRKDAFCDSADWANAEPVALLVSGDPQPQWPCTTRWDTIAEVGRTDG